MERCPSWLRGTPGKRVRLSWPRGFESRSLRHIRYAVLDGEVAVPCNLQSAVAGLMLSLRTHFVGSAFAK